LYSYEILRKFGGIDARLPKDTASTAAGRGRDRDAVRGGMQIKQSELTIVTQTKGTLSITGLTALHRGRGGGCYSGSIRLEALEHIIQVGLYLCSIFVCVLYMI